MVIQYFGQGEVKVSQGDWNLSFSAGKLRIGGRDGFEIVGPGEYEVNGTFVRAVPTDGPDNKINTAYSVLFDDIRLVHLGESLGAIKAEAKEVLSDADILFSPSSDYATTLDPKIIIPMYEAKGKDLPKPVDKLVVKRKDLEGKEGEVVPIISLPAAGR
ncbi:MAG TPA: MBL fold metallo-hydrolase [Candidatus Paceibacterota bacterium]